ncbi:MAG: SagB/ThcOx family dehydrogenase [Candidatus Thorarchaeota archaeon]
MEIKLPNPIKKGVKSIEECIYERESIRSFQEREIEINKISQILWATQGKKGDKRTVPSAGATYPLEIYALVKNKGLFHYNLNQHNLELISKDVNCEKLAIASWNQNFICEAYINIIICADYSRTTQRYGERGVRYVYMEVGHCAQNIHLEAVALGLASVPIGAFKDKRVKKELNLSENIDPLYIIPIGYKK